MLAKIIHSAISFGTFPKFRINFLINLEVIKIFTSEVQKCTELHPLKQLLCKPSRAFEKFQRFLRKMFRVDFLEGEIRSFISPTFFWGTGNIKNHVFFHKDMCVTSNPPSLEPKPSNSAAQCLWGVGSLGVSGVSPSMRKASMS